MSYCSLLCSPKSGKKWNGVVVTRRQHTADSSTRQSPPPPTSSSSARTRHCWKMNHPHSKSSPLRLSGSQAALGRGESHRFLPARQQGKKWRTKNKEKCKTNAVGGLSLYSQINEINKQIIWLCECGLLSVRARVYVQICGINNNHKK